MAQARVQILNEAMSDEGGGWHLCFQWCRYLYENNEIQHGYRFIWRKPPHGNIQPARGQARIPSLAKLKTLTDQAEREGWGGHDGDDGGHAAANG